MKSNVQKSWLDVHAAMRETTRRWIYDPNVRFVDFGYRIRDGKIVVDESPRIRVHVIRKITDPEQLEAAIRNGITHDVVEEEIGGFLTDVPEGFYRLNQGRRARMAPLQGGLSISDAYRYVAGTLGGLVRDNETDAAMILSNWHVLAGRWYARSGWPILQPGRADGGYAADMVARLSRHAMASSYDAAVATLADSRDIVNSQYELGRVTGVAWAQIGMNVVKSGRTSEVTRGYVTGVEGVARMPYSGVYRLIRNVMTIESHGRSTVSSPGDSGSFWLEEETGKVVGLHFAGGNNPERALAIDMPPILEALNVHVAVN